MADPAAKTEARAPEQRRRRRKRPRNATRPNEQTPAAVIARVADPKPVLSDKPVEEPLSAEELAELRQHLRFLRDHRRVLHLRVNAQEDLLLNEKREPTRRGVCLHLLSKVDRAHVFSAAERLEPKAALRLAEGVLRISPNIDYLLLYLDCVRRAQSAPQAVQALSRALERIDLHKLSPGQMRRVLDLLVELLEPRQLPLMLLGLLESAAFRQAFDASLAELPEALSALVVPLRAAQAVVLHGKQNRFGAEALERGMRLLLEADADAFGRRGPAVRRRLLALAIESGLARDPKLAQSLSALLASAGPELGFELAREWIAVERDAEAKRLLKRIADSGGSDAARAERWLQALNAPRVGRAALTRATEAGAERRLPAVYLGNMRAATLCELDAGELELVLSVIVPSLVPVLDHGRDESGRAWALLARPGRRLPALLDRRGKLERAELSSICAQACRVLAALAALGLELPDARLARFELDAAGRLWLSDLRGAKRADCGSAERAHAPLCVSFCHGVFELAREHLPRTELVRALESCETAADCARLLASDLG